MVRLSQCFFLILAWMTSVQLLANACSETDRANGLNRENSEFVDHWETCGLKSRGVASWTSGCLAQQYPKISTVCLNCLGQFSTCVRNSCWWSCFAGRGEKCETCAYQYCSSGIVSCTGIAYGDLPQKR